MDNIKTYSEIIKAIINKYVRFKPSHGDIRLDALFDDNNHRYALMQVFQPSYLRQEKKIISGHSL